jgi:hypothetical protein
LTIELSQRFTGECHGRIVAVFELDVPPGQHRRELCESLGRPVGAVVSKEKQLQRRRLSGCSRV